MGGVFSSGTAPPEPEHYIRAFGSKCPRSFVQLSSLSDLDLLLVRSKVQTHGASIDSRIAAGISLSQTMLVSDTVFNGVYDRVGIILTPSVVERSSYDVDNVEVVEATVTGIVTRPLRIVLSEAADCCIRSMRFQLDDAMRQSLTQSLMSIESDDAKFDDNQLEEERRLQLLLKLQSWLRQVANRPYSQCAKPLMPMLQHIKSQQDSYSEISSNELAAMEEIWMQHCTNPRGMRFDESVFSSFSPSLTLLPTENLHRLLQLFRTMSMDVRVRNTLNESEIINLLSKLDNEEKAASEPEERLLSKETFLSVWKGSLQRNGDSRKVTIRSLLSGAFVSMAFGEIGLLPVNVFFTPDQFAQLQMNQQSEPKLAELVEIKTQSEFSPFDHRRNKIRRASLASVKLQSSQQSSSAAIVDAITPSDGRAAVLLRTARFGPELRIQVSIDRGINRDAVEFL